MSSNEIIRGIPQLEECLGLPSGAMAELAKVAEVYPIQATRYYIGLARSKDWHTDPILMQCVPSPEELSCDNCGAPDALDECGKSPVPRLVHRYPDRALFLTCNSCAIHCRHCMRKRNWAISLPAPTDDELNACVKYVKAHTEIREILISGGDCLMLADETVKRILHAFASVDHVEMLRIGSRMPVVMPSRITPELCEILENCGKTVWVATHFNHPWEITPEAAKAADMLTRAGIPLVNQTVLLKNINDDAETMRQLFTGLLKIKIKPYYLFHGDPIKGAMHFRTGIQKGLDILNELRGRVSGMALPAYAFDLPGGEGKIRLQPEQIKEYSPSGNPVFVNYEGKSVEYC